MFAFHLFFAVLGAVIKKLWLPACGVVAVVVLITFISGGSPTVATIITVGALVVAAVAATFSALNKPW